MTTSQPKSTFWKTALIYGGLAGFLIISMMLISFEARGFHSDLGSMIVGFLVMFFILSLIFFGMKRFRDREQGGVIKFSKALLLGLAMSLFAGLAYVTVSEIYMAMTNHEFIGEYTNHLIEREKTKGVSGPELVEFTQKMQEMKANYAKASYRIPMTFAEIFPMGFIVTLVSALILHNPKVWARKG